MEDFSMEAVVIVADEKDNSTKEVEPANFLETRGKQRPEMEQPPVEQAKILDLTKLSYELQQGYRVYTELLSDSYKNVTWPFYEPVDAEALGLWDYHEKIKEPMSFSQIGSKFNNYEYSTVTEVISDVRLILENCYRYNGSAHWVSKLGQKLEKILEQKLALLNRSLRDKVSLKATMALKRNFISEEVADGTGRRRCTPRVSYLDMLNGDSSSSLLTHLKIQEDIEERERRRIREKEKKEANLVLLQDLAEWEEKELNPDVTKQLHSMWEIPSLAGFLFLLKDILYLQDISVAELELSFVYANKSSLLAKIYTALLLTPHQRKSLFKKPPMKFKVWELKLCDRVNSWYKAVEKDGQEMACSQCGLDMAIFDVLGDLNPLLEKSYMDLTLHQRVWILKCLCDNSLVRDHDVREQLTTISPADQRELFLGCDADNWQYLYFPLFSSVDLRFYKQCPSAAPALSKRKKKAPPPPVIKERKTSTRPATPVQTKRDSRLRKLKHTPSPEPELSPPPSPQQPERPVQEAKNTISEGFEMVAYDIDSLKKLCEKFKEPPPPPKKRGRKPKPPPPRKRCEVDLHQRLSALLEDLEKYEGSFSKLLSKAKIRIMKESMEPDPVDEPEEVVPDEAEGEWGSEESIGDEIEDAGAKNMSSDEDFVLEDEECRTPKPDTREKIGGEAEKSACAVTATLPPQKRKAGDLDEESKPASPAGKTNGVSCSIAIQTALPRLRKKKRHLLTSKGSQATAISTPNLTAPTVTQVKRLLHIPACLQQSEGLSGKVGGAKKCQGDVASTAAGLARVSNNNAFISIKNKQEETNRVLVKSHLTGQKTSVATTPSNTSVLATSRSVGDKPSDSVTPSTTLGLTKVVLLPSGEKMPVTASTLVKTVTLSKGHVTPSAVCAIPKTVSLSTGLVTPSTTSTLPRNVTLSKTSVTPSAASTPPMNVKLSKSHVTSTSPALVQTVPTVANPASSSSQTIPAVRYLTVPNASTTNISTAAGLGQVMFVTSSGVPLKVIRTVPVTQGVVQVKALTTQGKQTGTPTSLTSHLSNSLVLTPAKSTSVSLSNTVCTPLLSSVTSGAGSTPPVLVMQPSGSGEVLPFSAIKGGTVMVPAASASQKLVILKSPNVSASTASVTSSQSAKTALGQKVISSNIGTLSSINSVPPVKPAITSVSMVTATSSSDKISVFKPVYVNSNGVSRADGEQTTNVNTTSIKVCDSRIMNESAVVGGFNSTEPSGTEYSIPTKKAKQVEENVGTETDVKEPNSDFRTDLHEASVDLTCYETSVTDSAGLESDDTPNKRPETDYKLLNGVELSTTHVERPEIESPIMDDQNHRAEAVNPPSNTNVVSVDAKTAH